MADSTCSHSLKIWSWISSAKIWTSWGISNLKSQLESELISLLISCRNSVFQHLILSSSPENERNYINIFWIWCFLIRLKKNLLQLNRNKILHTEGPSCSFCELLRQSCFLACPWNEVCTSSDSDFIKRLFSLEANIQYSPL